MTFRVQIKTDNPAFEDWRSEVSRILRAAADQIESIGINSIDAGARLRDCNGNTVGTWKYEK